MSVKTTYGAGAVKKKIGDCEQFSFWGSFSDKGVTLACGEQTLFSALVSSAKKQLFSRRAKQDQKKSSALHRLVNIPIYSTYLPLFPSTGNTTS